MKNCPICHTSDNNHKLCEVCGYDPYDSGSERGEPEEYYFSDYLDNDDFDSAKEIIDDAFFEEFVESNRKQTISKLEHKNPNAEICVVCNNKTLIYGHICLYCGYDSDYDDTIASYNP